VKKIILAVIARTNALTALLALSLIFIGVAHFSTAIALIVLGGLLLLDVFVNTWRRAK
jgi:hypothetical protein